jgi:NADH-quinone oxidoreductase subunit J
MTPQVGIFYQFHFYLFGLIAVGAALLFVTRKSPVSAALWLVTTMFALAALYIMLDAQFIGAIQVLVYAGAIMVVFLFVIMLLNLGHPAEIADLRGKKPALIAAGLGLFLLADIYWVFRRGHVAAMPTAQPEAGGGGVVNVLAAPLFAANGYLLAFELTSILLLVAIIGAVVLAKRRS